MAIDRLGNPIAKDNLFRIPVRPVRPLMIEANGGVEGAVLFVYPEASEVEYLTGRVLEVIEDTSVAEVQVDGVEGLEMLDTRLLERTA